MKKKILSLALVASLIAIMVGGTLAYFTDNDEVTNTFTVGSVRIEIYENNEKTTSDVVAFKDPLVPGNYIQKAVKVENTGLNNAYIRTHIAIPKALVDYLELDLNLAADGWQQVAKSTATKDGVDYTVYTYDYTKLVVPGEFTPDLLKNVYLASDVDLEEDSAGSLWFVRKDDNGEITHRSNFLAHTKTTDGYESTKVNVLVASQAIQTEGFDNATVALNTGFGEGKNPWQP